MSFTLEEDLFVEKTWNFTHAVLINSRWGPWGTMTSQGTMIISTLQCKSTLRTTHKCQRLPGTTLMWSISYYLEENLSTPFTFQQTWLLFQSGLTSLPLGQSLVIFACANHTVYLFMYLHYVTHVREQNSLDCFLEVALFSVKDRWHL